MSSFTTQDRTKFIPFLDTCTSNNCSHTIGGVLSNSRTAWIACGAHIRVCDLRSGRRIGSWHFGHTIRDHSTQILCATELNHWSLLVVGLSSGLVCVYEPVTSRVLRAINIGTPVKCVTEVNSRPGRLAEAFDGVLAVGMDGGDVLLLDLCWHTIIEVLNIYSGRVINDEERPCEISVLNVCDLGRLNRLKERAATEGRHLAYHLNYHPAMDEPNTADGEQTPSEPHFPLQSPGGTDVLLSVPRSHCTITALMYAQPLCAVLIGYSLGCWQMFSLVDDMAAQYTSLWHRDRVPVAHFALQEPTDDPRTCCYVWAVHSHTGERTAACAVMYSLSYQGKESHDGYGCLYDQLTSCTIRFQMDLTSDVVTPAGDEGSKSAPTSSQCLATRSYSLGSASSGDALVLCALSYMTTGCDGLGGRTAYLLLFDLNQWYLSQMPSEPRPGQWPMYMSRIHLLPTNTNSTLDVRLDAASLRTFRHTLRRPEEHFRPDALSYTCSALTATGVTLHHHLGTQSHLLHTLHTLGPLALLKPVHLYGWAQQGGLLLHTPATTATAATIHQQREALLDIALEHHQLQHSVLERCATDWADGSSLAVGCGLHGWLMEWAWSRALTLKQDLDALCVMLFDGNDGVLLDGRAKAQLDAYTGQLGRLRRLFEHVRGLGELGDESASGWMVERRGETLGAVCRWLGVVKWLLTIGLLPERTHDDSATASGRPIDRVNMILTKCRTDINKTLTTKESKLPQPQLFIDALIENELGGAITLTNLWTNSNVTQPQPVPSPYPPASLQAALRTYLIQAQSTSPSPPPTDKLVQYQHTLFSYLMLDIAAAAAVQQPKHQQLIGFAVACAGLSQQRAKLIRAMWQLDNGMFEQAMEQLVDPSVTAHAPPWLHRCIVVQLLAHARHRFALLYVQLRRPPHLRGHDIVAASPSSDDDDDDWLMCTLFVRNGRLYDALKCARDNRKRRHGPRAAADDEDLVMMAEEEHNDDEELLSHIWGESLRSGHLNSNTLITSIHGLSCREEKSLFCYMDRIEYPNRHTMRAIYNTMQRSTKFAPPKPIPGDNHKFDGSVPMSVLIHYNNLIASNKSKSSSDKVLAKVHDTCVASVGAILRQQQQQVAADGNHQQRQMRGQKRKQQQPQQRVGKTQNCEDKRPALSTFYRENQQDVYSSPRKRMKYTPTAGDKKLDSSYQMETPLVRRQRPHLPQHHNTPSMTASTDYYRTENNVETPQSILKKRIAVGEYVEQQRSKGESTTPEVIDDGDDDAAATNVKLVMSPKRRRSIGRTDVVTPPATAAAVATVRFDISLSTTSSTTSADSCTTPQQLATDSDVTNATATTTTETTETTFYSPNNSSGDNVVEVGDNNSEELAQSLPEVIGRAKSPMRRKPIRGVSEECDSGMRSSPRLQQRRGSADRDIKQIQSTPVLSSLKGDVELSGRKSTQVDVTVELNKTTPEKELHVDAAKKTSFMTKTSASSTKTLSKCTLFSVDGIERIHEESTITVDEEETSSSKTVDIIENDVNRLDKIMETAKQKVEGATSSIDNTNEEIVEYLQSTTEPVKIDVELFDLKPQDVLHEREDGSADDIYEDLDCLPVEVGPEETIQSHLFDVEDEPMEVDDENDVIEIVSSSNDDDSSVNSGRRQHRSSEEENNSCNTTYSEDGASSRESDIVSSEQLNRAAFIRVDDSRSGQDSNSQFSHRLHRSSSDSIESAEICRLSDDIDVTNDDDGGNNLDREKQRNTDDESVISNQKNESPEDDDDSDSCILNLNMIRETSLTISVNADDEKEISVAAEVDIDILQVTCAETATVDRVMDPDVLCMSYPDESDCLTFGGVVINESVLETTAKEVEIDPIIEASVIEEVIHVEPDILSVTFTEQQQQSDIQTINDVVGTRRSARLRRDSAASNSSISSKKLSVVTVKPAPSRKPRTTRSLSADDEEQSSRCEDSRSIVTKPARRSDRRTRSVDTQQLEAMEDVKQQWLCTIVEEQQQQRENSQIWSKSALEVVAEVSQDVSREVRSAAGLRQCRSASVDSPSTQVIIDKPKRGRPRRKAPQPSPAGSLSVTVVGGSPMITRTRTRTNSTSSTKSDSILTTSARRRNSTTILLAKIEEKGETATAALEGGTVTPPKRSRRGNRTKQQ